MRKIAVAALCAVLSTTAVASAQNADPASAATVPGVELKRLDLQLDGLPLPEVINYLSETTGRNIVLMMPRTIEPGSIVVPTMKLKHVSLEQVLDLITQMPGVEMSYDVSGEGESAIYQIRVERIDYVDQPIAGDPMGAVPGAPVMVGGQPFGAMNAEPYLSVIPLERMLLGANPSERIPEEAKRAELLAARTKQALTLIDQAFAMNAGNEPKPEIKLHQDTNTLLVKASPMQLQTITQVLNALEVPGRSKEERDFDRLRQDMVRDFEAERRDQQNAMEHKLRMMEEQLVRSQQSRDDLEKRTQELIQQLEQIKAQLKAAQGNTHPQ